MERICSSYCFEVGDLISRSLINAATTPSAEKIIRKSWFIAVIALMQKKNLKTLRKWVVYVPAVVLPKSVSMGMSMKNPISVVLGSILRNNQSIFLPKGVQRQNRHIINHSKLLGRFRESCNTLDVTRWIPWWRNRKPCQHHNKFKWQHTTELYFSGEQNAASTPYTHPNKNRKWDPLRAVKTFIRRKVGHTT